MNKRNAIFMAILTFLSSTMTCAMNNDQWQNSEAADRLAAIYQADQLGELHMLSNLESSIIILQNHIKSLESQKSNYSGVFGGKIGTALSLITSASLALNSFIYGHLASEALNIIDAYQYKNATLISGTNRFKEYLKTAKTLTPSQYKLLETLTARAIIATPLFALAAGGLFWYSLNKYDAVQKDMRLNVEIKRDQEIIEKLQAIQAVINTTYYQ